jgi:hypothetical protein
VSNIGTRKANDVNIKIKFPDSVQVLSKEDMYENGNYSLGGFNVSFPRLRRLTIGERWIDVKNNIVTIHIQNLLHTKKYIFDKDDGIFLISFKEAKTQAEINIICEEFTKEENFILHIDISME